MDLLFYIHDHSFANENYLSIKKLLERCLVDVLHFTPLESTKSNGFGIKENILKVEAVVKILEDHFPTATSTLRAQYEFFIKWWCKRARHIKPPLAPALTSLLKFPMRGEIPWLILDSENSFPFTKRASHEKVSLHKFQLGTLVTSTFFFVHFEQLGQNDYCSKIAEVSFFHDIRQVDILLGKKNTLSFTYDNIRRVMFEIKDDMALIYLHLNNPPEVSIKEQNVDYGGLSRVQCLKKISSDVIGRSNMICLQVRQQELAWDILSRLYFRRFKSPIAVVVMDSTFFNAPTPNLEVDLGHFGCTYMLHAIFKRNFCFQLQNLGEDMEDILGLFKNLTVTNSDYMYETLVEILQAIDEGVFFHYRTAVFNSFTKKWEDKNENLDSETKKYLLPPRMRKVWRVIVTPTRFVFYPAEINFENRIIRNYDPDYAIRVSFRDENFKKISYSGARATPAFVKDVLIETVTRGMKIGSRHFEFLGWSNSQLRDHSVFMYAKDYNGNTSESIRSWMGNFTHIKSVAKFMARMGQCFSHSEAADTIKLDLSRIRTVSDIVHGINPVNGKPYVFSDGIGKISETLMKDV